MKTRLVIYAVMMSFIRATTTFFAIIDLRLTPWSISFIDGILVLRASGFVGVSLSRRVAFSAHHFLHSRHLRCWFGLVRLLLGLVRLLLLVGLRCCPSVRPSVVRSVLCPSVSVTGFFKLRVCSGLRCCVELLPFDRSASSVCLSASSFLLLLLLLLLSLLVLLSLRACIFCWSSSSGFLCCVCLCVCVLINTVSSASKPAS
jgi:hypothetical protein